MKYATKYIPADSPHLVCLVAPEIFGDAKFHDALLLRSRRNSMQRNWTCTLAADEPLYWAIDKRWSEISQELTRRSWSWSFGRFGSFGHYGMVVTTWRDRYWEFMGPEWRAQQQAAFRRNDAEHREWMRQWCQRNGFLFLQTPCGYKTLRAEDPRSD